jgi:signal peptidase I
MQKRRRPILASLLNATSPGLGFLYVGNLKLAIVFPMLCILLIGMSAWSRAIFTPTGFALVSGCAIVVWVFSLGWAFMLARRAGVVELSRVQTWYGYLGFFVVSSLAFNVALESRAKIFGYETFRFPSRSSMNDTLINGDFIIADTWAFQSRIPERGEVVVFRYPLDPSIKYVKRVIGLPGDTIDIRDGKVYVNGQELSESYVHSDNNQQLSYERPARYRVPAEAFFLMGDNRDNSNDSRFWGFVPRGHLHGTVVFVWFSFSPEQGVRWDRVGNYVKQR